MFISMFPELLNEAQRTIVKQAKDADEKYLTGQLLTNVEYCIENNKVKITSPSTMYVGLTRYSPSTNKTTWISLYKNVLKMAKEKNIKISYQNHYRRTIDNRWEEFETRCKEIDIMFDDIITQALVVQRRGLYMGTVDDMELKILSALSEKYSKIYHGGSVTSLMSGVFMELTANEKSLSHTYEYENIIL